MLVERKACCHVVNAVLSRLDLIWPIASRKISKMPQNCGFGKTLQASQWAGLNTAKHAP